MFTALPFSADTLQNTFELVGSNSYTYNIFLNTIITFSNLIRTDLTFFFPNPYPVVTTGSVWRYTATAIAILGAPTIFQPANINNIFITSSTISITISYSEIAINGTYAFSFGLGLS
jgi:hypothetical protein